MIRVLRPGPVADPASAVKTVLRASFAGTG